MRVDWSDEALEELWEIIDYIDTRNPSAAAALHWDIEQATQSLPSQPYMHRLGRILGTREIIVHPNYLVIYRVLDHIEILNVVHARQEYP
ncbi:MAG: type II toxin-antitoxin system RelE/ParE family toxin [Chania sp.]